MDRAIPTEPGSRNLRWIRGGGWFPWFVTLASVLSLQSTGMAVSKKTAEIHTAKLAPSGTLTIDHFQKLEWSPESGRFQSFGPIQIRYEDRLTHEVTTLLADSAKGDAQTGLVSTAGKVTLLNPEGKLTGENLNYNFRNKSGSLTNAFVTTNYINATGSKIETLTNGSIRILNANITTCRLKHSDYHISAREATLTPKGRLIAKNIGFWFGPTHFLSLPYFTKDFSNTVQNPLPLPTYSKEGGVQFRISNSVAESAHQHASYDLLISGKRSPEGNIIYEHELGAESLGKQPQQDILFLSGDPLRSPIGYILSPNQTVEDNGPHTALYGLISLKQTLYNRLRTDLRLSRFPSVGILATNVLAHQTAMSGQSHPSGVNTEPVYREPFRLDLQASAERLTEYPDGIHQGRIALRASLLTLPHRISHQLALQEALTGYYNFYSRGDTYGLLAPEIALTYVPNSSTVLGVAYRYETSIGRTPFIFDRLDVRHELQLSYGCQAAHWIYGIGMSVDLSRGREYDSEFQILRRLDCMSFGIGYQTRTQSFQILLNLFPAKRSSAR